LSEKERVESGGIIEAAGGPPFLPVEPGYKSVLRLRYAISWGFLAVVALIIDRSVLGETPLAGLPPLAALAIGLFTTLVFPARIYRRLRYRLTDRLLQVLRGWLFHTDTVVPLVRVQHLDVVRGPLDKMFGTASLVVHTAGTHNSIVTVPGLAPDRAAEMRDIIREHVRTDFE
jgi:membrane protein YdbS with pleckstrin-like domain